ncbi:MAG: hypothetical protein AAB152_06625 [Candidatus Coatesbacteria bacterium]
MRRATRIMALDGMRGLVAACVVGLLPVSARANCVADVTVMSGEATQFVFFPNWLKAYAGAFTVSDWAVSCGGACAGAPNCSTGAPPACGALAQQVAGLTIVNFGTGTSGQAGSSWDIAAVYWRSDADAAGFYHTLTACAPKMWTWAWNGVEVNPDMSALPNLRIYADISATPADGATVQLGIPYDDINVAAGFSDTCCCSAPWNDVSSSPKTILYAFKTVDRISAAPGDLLNYTIYYGRPGNVPVTNLEILDTQPDYTHYVIGSANPPPDPGWDPDPGPPLRLRWTIPGPLTQTGGATGAITFQLSIDWGINPFIDPQGGDVGAPEGYNLWNRATATFPTLGAGQRVHLSNQTRTTVIRYLFWKLADRDVLFNCTPTMCDELTYSIFIKNLSGTMKWWNVSIWDTVPPEVDPWGDGYGFDDPCVGWTMTPSGCAAASPGWTVVSGKTILTWKLDMPPGMTLTVQWKAQVRPQATAGSTAINRVSILEYGNTGVAGGTGHSGVPRNFTHTAPVVLRTTYVSYVSYDVTSDFDGKGNWYFIAFYPLHPAAVWQLYYLNGDCNLNPSITAPAPSVPCNSWPGAGCSVGPERRPQVYGGNGTFTTCCGTLPFKDFYKLVSNAPLLWELNPNIDETNQDSVMYCPATSLSFKGNMVYTWRRQNSAQAGNASYGDYLGIVNTGNVATTVHLFSWDGANSVWSYEETRAIDPLSQYMAGGTTAALEGHWRVISSDTDLIVWKGYAFENPITDYDNFSTTAAATNGNLTGGAGSIFYCYTGKQGGWQTMVVTNVGVNPAKTELWRYESAEPMLVVNAVPTVLGGSSGTWKPVDAGTIPAGLSSVGTPHNPLAYTTLVCDANSVPFPDTFGLYQLKVLSGGPVQVRTGRGAGSRYGGYVMHGVDESGTVPQQVPASFWHTQHRQDPANDLVAFCPATGMVVRCTSGAGYSAVFTTTGPDQPIAFCAMTEPAGNCGVNYKVEVLAPAGGRVIGMMNATYFTERHYAAPFLATGTHYDIQAPAVVFAGQSFWITVVVLNTAGGTKTDYCGSTSFTSTDPSAKIEGAGLDSYNFTWSSSSACSVVPNENGVKVFINVILSKLGVQTIIGNDINDGSITGLTAILVTGADVKIFKEPKLTVAASGDTVRFKVCWSNYSSASAFSMVMTDAIPVGMTFIPEASTAAFDCKSTDGVGITVSYSTAPSAAMPSAASFTSANPVAGTRWLRWTVPMAGVQTTGCACYRVQVN